MVQFISLISILVTYSLFISYLNLFPSQKMRKNTIYAPFDKAGASTEKQKCLNINPVPESDIGFLLEFDQYSSG